MHLAFLLYKYFPYGGLQRDFARFVVLLQQQWPPLPGVLHAAGRVSSCRGSVRLAPGFTGSNVRRNQHFSEWAQAELAAAPVDGVIGFNKMPGLDVYYAADPCFLDKALWGRGLFTAWAGGSVTLPPGKGGVRSAASTEILPYPPANSASSTPLPRAGAHAPVASRCGAGSAAIRRTLSPVAPAPVTSWALLTMCIPCCWWVPVLSPGLDRAIRGLACCGPRIPRRFRLLVAGQDGAGRFSLLARRQQVQQGDLSAAVRILPI